MQTLKPLIVYHIPPFVKMCVFFILVPPPSLSLLLAWFFFLSVFIWAVLHSCVRRYDYGCWYSNISNWMNASYIQTVSTCNENAIGLATCMHILRIHRHKCNVCNSDSLMTAKKRASRSHGIDYVIDYIISLMAGAVDKLVIVSAFTHSRVLYKHSHFIIQRELKYICMA